MGDVNIKLDRPRNVDRGVRTIAFWGRVVWDKGPIVQLRLPPFKRRDQERLLEIRCFKPYVRLALYNNEAPGC